MHLSMLPLLFKDLGSHNDVFREHTKNIEVTYYFVCHFVILIFYQMGLITWLNKGWG